MVILGWLVSRAFLVVVTVQNTGFYPSAPLALADINVYTGWLDSLAAGITPVDDMWQYPPLSGVFFLVGLVGPSPVAALVGAILVTDLALTLVLFRHSHVSGWFWVGSGLAVGPILIARFDVVPTLFAVLAVLAAGRPLAAGAWSAIGTALKVWPMLVMVVVPRKQMGRAGAVFVGVSITIILITSQVFTGARGFLTGQGSRGLQIESVAALPFLVARAFGMDVELEYRYGAMEVVAPGSGAAATAMVAGSLLLLSWVGVVWWRGRLSRRLPADVAVTVVLISVVTSRVFSPQFMIWLLGLGAISWAAGRTALRPAIVLMVLATVIAQILYPGSYTALIAGEWWAVALQALRITLMLVATGLAARATLLSGRTGSASSKRAVRSPGELATAQPTEFSGPPPDR